MPPSWSWNGPAPFRATHPTGSHWVQKAKRARCSVGAGGTGLSFRSLQIGSNHVDQVSGALCLLGVLFMGGIHNVMADVILKQLGGEATDGPPHRSNQHQNIGTANLRL